MCHPSCLLCSSDQNERLGGVLSVDELIDVKVMQLHVSASWIIHTLSPSAYYIPVCLCTCQSSFTNSKQHGINLSLCVQLLGENAAKISNFATYLRSVFRTDTDPVTLEVAAATLGHLVQTGGALTADVVEYEVITARPCFSCSTEQCLLIATDYSMHDSKSACWSCCCILL